LLTFIRHDGIYFCKETGDKESREEDKEEEEEEACEHKEIKEF
jgi:hypothetical protein